MKEVDLFLEYKFRDFTDEELKSPGALGVMAAFENLNSDRVEQTKRLGFNFGVSFVSLPGKDVCPASRQAEEFLRNKIEGALSLKPDVIWFDHLRFEGHWESAVKSISRIHPRCQYCERKDRTEVIVDLGNVARRAIPKDIKTGYFAVPFKREDLGGWEDILGQDHKKLGQIFDYVSPMLYHRMINKPVSYIGEYVRYLASLKIRAEILPIVQLKDMPDNLEDKLTTSEIGNEVKEALTSPSIGVAVFSWDQAIEKNKLKAVSKILGGVNP